MIIINYYVGTINDLDKYASCFWTFSRITCILLFHKFGTEKNDISQIIFTRDKYILYGGVWSSLSSSIKGCIT